MNRAYIFTLDVVIAAAVLTTLMTSMYFMLGEMNPNTPDIKYITATDSLATLDLSGDLKKALKNSDDSKLKEYLDNAMNPQFCAGITARDEDGSLVFNTTKSGCGGEKEEISIARRMVMVKGDPYRFKMEVWNS